ncbi:MAG: cytochrome c [Candidatus Sulfotelmatobacter sp.]
MKTIGHALLAAILTAAVFAQNSNSPPPLTASAVYQHNCSKCHGKSAEGRTFAGPSLVSQKTTSMSADDLRKIIAEGRHRMPKFEGKLTAEEIDALVSQIKTHNK